MKHTFIKLLSLVSMSFLLGACQDTETATEKKASAPSTTESEESVELVDRKVEISEGTAFLQMDESEKASAYAELDEIDLFTGEVAPTSAMSNMINVDSEADYAQLLINTKDQPAIVYLGFDDCPFCKVFSPKLNQLASEFDLDIYYYNTHERDKDATFANAMQLYNVQTVPHAFIVENGEPGSKVNHESTMIEIEAFLAEFSELLGN